MVLVNLKYSHYKQIGINVFCISAVLQDKLLGSSSQEQIIAATEKNEKYITYKVIDVV